MVFPSNKLSGKLNAVILISEATVGNLLNVFKVRMSRNKEMNVKHISPF